MVIYVNKGIKPVNFVATTGYPGSGKSTMTMYLNDELDFARFSTDKIPHWFEMSDDEKMAAFARLYNDLQENIREGKNSTLDTTLYSDEWRKGVFTGLVNPCEKYLIWMKQGPDLQNKVIEERIKKGFWKQSDRDIIERWKTEMGWEDPKPNSDYNLIVYENNRPGDLNLIRKDLRQRFA